jgi:outer membrane protein OmpA-like peptidoglycan-associated protein
VKRDSVYRINQQCIRGLGLLLRNLPALCVCLTAGTGRFAFANAVGPDMQNFNATPDGLDFVTVQSSETLKSGYWNFGLFVNQANGTLPTFPKDGSNRLTGRYRDSLVGMDLNLAVGVTQRLTLALSLPQILAQSVKNQDGVVQGQFLKNGTTEIRPLAKYHLSGDSRGGLAALVSVGINMVEDNPYTGLGAPPIVNLELAMDASRGPVSAGVNVGYRHRTPGKPLSDAPVEPLGSQWIASMAASVLVSPIKSRIIGEVFGGAPVKSTTNRSDRMLSSAEALLGIKYMASHALALHAGAGRELVKGLASPDFRVYAGLNYSIGPSDEKQQKEPVVKRASRLKAKQVAADFMPETSDDLILTDVVPETSVPPLGEETFVINNVFFAFDRDNLVAPGGRDILRRLAVYLMKAPEFKRMTIEGHTDFIGSETYNNALSLRRAETLKRYLVEVLKIDSSRISVIGYGESRPIEDNGNFQGRQANRRAEFKIVR